MQDQSRAKLGTHLNIDFSISETAKLNFGNSIEAVAHLGGSWVDPKQI
jgi:hypothetical protein